MDFTCYINLVLSCLYGESRPNFFFHMKKLSIYSKGYINIQGRTPPNEVSKKTQLVEIARQIRQINQCHKNSNRIKATGPHVSQPTGLKENTAGGNSTANPAKKPMPQKQQ